MFAVEPAAAVGGHRFKFTNVRVARANYATSALLLHLKSNPRSLGAISMALHTISLQRSFYCVFSKYYLLTMLLDTKYFLTTFLNIHPPGILLSFIKINFPSLSTFKDLI